MVSNIFPPAPEDSELARWIDEGFRREPSHSNILYVGSPNEQYTLQVELDDPVRGYLIQLFAADRDDAHPIGRTVVDDRDLALDAAADMVAAADDLDALADDPHLGPDTVNQVDVERGEIEPPEEWNNEEWDDTLENAFEKAEIPRSKGTLTTKTIDGRNYYYLQWREGDTITSQYVAPVNPS